MNNGPKELPEDEIEAFLLGLIMMESDKREFVDIEEVLKELRS